MGAEWPYLTPFPFNNRRDQLHPDFFAGCAEPLLSRDWKERYETVRMRLRNSCRRLATVQRCVSNSDQTRTLNWA